MSQYTHLGGSFWKSDTGVFCEWHPLKLDPATVKVYFGTWATDGERVYRDMYSKPKIDAKTFTALNDIYAKDAAQCYCECIQINKVIPKADPATFAVLDSGDESLMRGLGRNLPSGYARDCRQVYFNGNALKKADSSTFVSLGGCFGRDASNIYFEDGRLPNVDPQRWRRIGGEYSRDEQYVFWQHKVIKNAVPFDFQQIEPFGHDHAYDGERFYSRDEPISQAEYVATLQREAEWLKDFAKLCSTGKWQRGVYDADWAYREPDETLYAMKQVGLDQWVKSIEKTLGPGKPVLFKSANQYIKFLHGPNATDDAAKHELPSEYQPDPSRKHLLSWRYLDYVLVCEVLKGKIEGSTLVQIEHRTKS